ncbi:ATP-binding protein [Varunaivibrio sulfuroxidans]|uniref:ATP-binding protein n=1 Tax=Varunaivibrio sulfuroxidans TaxID=1773489 RepID=UPI001405205A|nr:ATP-binding protein [Varunaivibrio sulfuroxidans]WES31209.1 ATP-binding protein [Varunaivibrio sulfuroxidans]
MALLVVLFSAFITLITTAAQLIFEYRRDVSEITRTIDRIRTGQLQSLSSSAWVIDGQQIKDQLEGLSRLPGIEYLELTLTSGEKWTAGERVSGRSIVASIPLLHRYHGENRIIAHVRVVASLDAVVGRLIDQGVVLFAVNAVKFFLVAGFMLFLFHSQITRHLLAIAQSLQDFDPSKKNPRLTLSRKKHRAEGGDELDDAVRIINQMQENIEVTYSAMDDAREELEERVEKRTRELRKRVDAHEIAERELARSQRMLSQHLENMPMAAISWSPKLVCRGWNAAAEKIFGFKRTEMIGRACLDRMVEAEELDVAKQTLFDMMRAKRPMQSTHRNKREDGSIIMCEWFDAPLLDENGDVVGVASLGMDVTARMAAEKALQEAKASAEIARKEAVRANNAKSDFLSSMSHELRTPLNAILGFSQLLKCDINSPLPETQAENIDQIVKGGNHLLGLVNQILDLSKIESGKVTVSIEEVDFLDVLEECLSFIAPVAESRKVSIRCVVAPHHHIYVRADYTRLKQVILNLLSNAVKYNHEGGEVRIKLEIDGDGFARLRISDTGIGIPEHEFINVFKPFSRLNVEQSEIEGTGIGLTISKQLILMMDGHIGFHSIEGQGADFWIDIPLVSSSSPFVEILGENDPDIIRRVARGENFPSGRLDVLYIDDTAANLVLMEKIFSTLPQLNLVCASSLESGMKEAQKTPPGAVLVDLDFSGSSGTIVIKKIRENNMLRDVPVIALSANIMPSEVASSLEAGVEHYLTKPFDSAALIEVLNESLHLGARAQVSLV